MRLKWLTHPSRLLSGNARSAILICFSRMTQLHYLVRINEGRGSVGSCVGPDTHTMKTSPCLKLSKRHELPSPKQFYLVLTPFLTKIKKQSRNFKENNTTTSSAVKLDHVLRINCMPWKSHWYSCHHLQSPGTCNSKRTSKSTVYSHYLPRREMWDKAPSLSGEPSSEFIWFSVRFPF